MASHPQRDSPLDARRKKRSLGLLQQGPSDRYFWPAYVPSSRNVNSARSPPSVLFADVVACTRDSLSYKIIKEVFMAREISLDDITEETRYTSFYNLHAI